MSEFKLCEKITPETKAKIEAFMIKNYPETTPNWIKEIILNNLTNGYNLAVEKIKELEWKDKMLGEQLAASESTIEELEARVEKAESKAEFVKQYYNPSDTRFKTLVHNFMELPEEKKLKLIELVDTLRKLND